jgi:hypothetical protein
MTPLFPELSDDLAAAADRAGRTRRRRVLPVIGGGLSIVALAGVATAATGVWHPQIGDERRGTPTLSATAVPAEQLRVLGVLRRPATPEDRNAEVRGVLRLVGRGYRGVRTDAVRRLAPASGTSGAQILIPAQRAHGTDDALCLYVVDPADGAGSSCFTTKAVTDGRALVVTGRPAPLTAAQQRRAMRSSRIALRENRAARRALRRSLEPLPADRRARHRLLQRAYVERNLNSIESYYPPPRFLEVNYFGLVPDGVASVTRIAKDGTATAPVRNNLFHIRVVRGTMSRSTLIWRDGRGATIKRVPGP